MMTESFTETMQRECAPIWDAQLVHPFVVALADGILPRETFQFYILQDARFLVDLAKAFAFAVTKTDDRERILRLSEFALDTVRVERGLHEMYAERFGLHRRVCPFRHEKTLHFEVAAFARREETNVHLMVRSAADFIGVQPGIDLADIF